MPCSLPSLSIVAPVGSVPPVCVNVYGAVPPEGAGVWLYAVPAVPSGYRSTVTFGQLIVKIYCLESVQPLASVTITVNVSTSAAVGVPVR